jgi:hypothetical protein
MTSEQVTLLAQLLTLAGIAISIGWGTIQHHWTETERKETARKLEQERREDAEKLDEQRREDAAQLESDRVLLAQALEQQRQETLDATEAALEKRAAEIRKSLDEQAELIRKRQETLADKLDQAAIERGHMADSLGTLRDEVESNTSLTQNAVDNAKDAYHEAGAALVVANSTNAKIIRIADATLLASQREQRSIRDTGEDTNARVQRVEGAVVQSEANAADVAAQTSERLSRLEDPSPPAD